MSLRPENSASSYKLPQSVETSVGRFWPTFSSGQESVTSARVHWGFSTPFARLPGQARLVAGGERDHILDAGPEASAQVGRLAGDGDERAGRLLAREHLSGAARVERRLDPVDSGDPLGGHSAVVSPNSPALALGKFGPIP
jgi:hypothetical protein